MADGKNVRCNFEVPEELFERLKGLPWGTRANVIRILLERVLDAIDEHGQVIIGAILSGEYAFIYQPKEASPPGTTAKKRRKR